VESLSPEIVNELKHAAPRASASWPCVLGVRTSALRTAPKFSQCLLTMRTKWSPLGAQEHPVDSARSVPRSHQTSGSHSAVLSMPRKISPTSLASAKRSFK